MKFLDRIGLAKSIEIPTYSSSEEFEQQLLKFKYSGKDKPGFLSTASFTPAELTIEKGEFILSKVPRLFRPLAPVGEIRGLIKLSENNTIEVRIFSTYYLLMLILFISLLLVGTLMYLSKSPIINKVSFILVLMGFNAMTYLILRKSANRLEKEFRVFN